MSQTPSPGPDAPSVPLYDRENRGVAMLNYGLLFTSIFFAGIPALIAVSLAYARKSKTGPGLKTHFRFQIRIFWIAFFLALLAGACGIAGVILAVVELARGAGMWPWDGIDLRTTRVGADVVLLLVAAVVLSLIDAVWLMASSAFGFIRLASDPSLSKSAA